MNTFIYVSPFQITVTRYPLKWINILFVFTLNVSIYRQRILLWNMTDKKGFSLLYNIKCKTDFTGKMCMKQILYHIFRIYLVVSLVEFWISVWPHWCSWSQNGQSSSIYSRVKDFTPSRSGLYRQRYTAWELHEGIVDTVKRSRRCRSMTSEISDGISSSHCVCENLYWLLMANYVHAWEILVQWLSGSVIQQLLLCVFKWPHMSKQCRQF